MFKVPGSSPLLALQMTWPIVTSLSWQWEAFSLSVNFFRWLLQIENWQPGVSPYLTPQNSKEQQCCKLSNFSALINQKSDQTLRPKEAALASASVLMFGVAIIHLAEETLSVFFMYLQSCLFAVATVINLHIII